MAQDFAAANARFSVGRVISDSVSVLIRNIVPFGLIALLVGIPMIVLIAMGATVNVGAMNFEVQAEAGSGLSTGTAIGVMVFGILFLLTYFITQAAINYGSFQDLRGQRASIGECIGRGFASLPGVIGAIIVLIVAVVAIFAVIFLVGAAVPSLAFLIAIPVVIGYFVAFVMIWVFVPAIVVERVGPIACFGRSRELTNGHRWGILGLVLVVAIAQWVIGYIVGTVGLVLGPTIASILHTLITLLFTAFSGVMTAVGYYYLRAEKEGFGVDDLAKVFD